MAAFITVPFNIVGGTYESRSDTLSTQRTVNMYQQLNPKVASQINLQSFPGQKLLQGVDGELDRNTHNMAEVLYRVVDEVLYSVNETGVHTSLGDITGTNRCVFADDGLFADSPLTTEQKTYY